MQPLLFYFLVIPSLIFIYATCAIEKEKLLNLVIKMEISKSNQSMVKVILIAILMFFIFMLYLPMSYKLPTMIVENGIGTTSTAAMVAGFSTLVGIPIGVTFGFFF